MTDNTVNIKHKKVLMEMVENGGKVGPAMIQAGYSPTTAKTPSKLTSTKKWKKLMKKYIPDKLLVKVTKEGLRATMVKTSLTEPDRTLPDFGVRQRYLETALKMKGKLVERTDLTTDGKIINLNIEEILNKAYGSK